MCIPHAAPLVTSDSSVVPWLTAVLGAVLAAVIGFLIHAIQARQQDKQGFLALLGELLSELQEIKTQAERRARSTLTVAGKLEAPLPVEAWHLVRSTGKLAKLPPQPLGRLRILYSKVASANYLAGQWVDFLQISRLSSNEDIRDAFDKEAARIVSEPCSAVATDAPCVITDIQKVISDWKKFVRPRPGKSST